MATLSMASAAVPAFSKTPLRPVAENSKPSGDDSLASSDWEGIRAAYDKGRHAIRRDQMTKGHWLGTNPGQRWRTRFDGTGFLITPNGQPEDQAPWTWGFVLQSYGYKGQERPVASTAVPNTREAANGRFAYQHDDTISEWFVNDKRGLEHGFTLTRRPTAMHLGGKIAEQENLAQLQLTMAVRGNLRPKVSADGQNIRF
ncbi:MAG TPA: hypothetical protein VD994_09520, partial [Prosthecobacter sp.]|nr:hypothetical protein [Prosthecobacter sp.]